MPSETPGAGSAEPQIDWDALARCLAGESPAAERAAVQQWLGSRPDDARMLSALDDVLGGLTLGADSARSVDVEAALARVNARREVAVRPLAGHVVQRASRGTMPQAPASRWMTYAAAAALIIALGALVLRGRTSEQLEAPQIAARTFTTPVGGRDSLVLSDGSVVVLGPGSELTVAEGYGLTSRRVAIRGEAFFDVKHDASRPFVVWAHGTLIRDIGTAFVVHSDSSGNVRVAVTEGIVEVMPARDTSGATRLNAGDVAVVSAGGDVIAQRGKGTPDDLAWTRGRLVFRDTPLADVRDDLRRWYGIHLDVRDSTLLRRPLSASFQDDSISGVLDVIALALGATIERRGDTAVVKLMPGGNRRE